MSNTYTQLYIHLVFATKVRFHLINNHNKEEIYQYMGGIIKQSGNYPIIINGTSDHVHLLLRYKADCNISDLVKNIKACISAQINKNKWASCKFEWQKGYAGFSVSKSQVEKVYHYIEIQEKHHEKKCFFDEYIELLEAHGIEYIKEFLFEKLE